MRLPRTIWTFEAVGGVLAQFVERLFGDDVTAWHHHWWILVCRLFFGDRANENGVEVVIWG